MLVLFGVLLLALGASAALAQGVATVAAELEDAEDKDPETGSPLA